MTHAHIVHICDIIYIYIFYIIYFLFNNAGKYNFSNLKTKDSSFDYK